MEDSDPVTLFRRVIQDDEITGENSGIDSIDELLDILRARIEDLPPLGIIQGDNTPGMNNKIERVNELVDILNARGVDIMTADYGKRVVQGADSAGVNIDIKHSNENINWSNRFMERFRKAEQRTTDGSDKKTNLLLTLRGNVSGFDDNVLGDSFLSINHGQFRCHK